MAPRVLVDATAVPADRGGVGRYVDGLLAALASAGADLAIVCQRTDAERYGRIAPQARIVPGPAAISHRPARLAWEQASLPLVAQQVGADVIHAPYYSVPLRPGRPVVVTIHDVSVFSMPEIHSPVKAGFYRSATKTAIHRAARVIVPSKATRDELVLLLDADPSIIDVAYHGVDTEQFHLPSEQERRRVSERLGLHGLPYVAFLGEIAPRKNVPELVHGWAAAVQDLDQPPALVLAGSTGWDGDVDRAVAEVPSHLRVVRPGYLRVSDLPGYLGGALVVAYPSQAEGFGLPVLEAMACGATVLTARRLSLPEVGGDAVAYTEPDAASIAEGLRRLLADDEARRALGAAGHARAREFTWAASAEAHMASYSRAVGGG
ncbi:MAG TPA: glycosyltransferase family 1 protein [Actinomycetes bacterium]|nr:glycosyltransferase family 1 protein [Actinomycetes bacterium]